MNYYTCLILGGNEGRCASIAKCASEEDFSVVKTRGIIEFIHLYGFYKPECVVIDYDSFGGDPLLDALMHSGKGFLSDAIMISDKTKNNATAVTFDSLCDVLREKKKCITELKLINISKNDMKKASSIVSQKLLQLGLVPKYNGFYMLVDIVVFTCIGSGKCPTLHKFILPAVAHNFDTTVTNLTQCIRKLISSRQPNDLYPYDKPTLKQMVKFISELVRDDLYELMHSNNESCAC